MAGLADTIADNAVYAVLAVVLFALFFLALNGAMEGDGGPAEVNASDPGATDDGGNGTADAPNATDDTLNETETDAGDDEGNATDDGTANTTDDGNASTTLDVARVETLLIQAVDRERNASNVSEIAWVRTGALREMAAYHTADMINHGYLAVESPGGEGLDDRKESFQPDCDGRALAELVGRVDTTASDGTRRNASSLVSTLVDGWLDQRSDTVLRNNTSMGAVAADVDADGRQVYVTIDLC